MAIADVAASALARAARPDRLRGGARTPWSSTRLLEARQRRPSSRRQRPAVDDDGRRTARRRPRRRASTRRTYVVRSRRHAVLDLARDRRLGRHAPGAEPRCRRAGAPAGQRLKLLARDRARARPRCWPRCACSLALGLARPARRAAGRAAVDPRPRRDPRRSRRPATSSSARGATASRPIASTTKLMTALLTLERAKLSDRHHRGRPTTRAPAESVIGLRAGERMTVADLLRGAAARERQRRGRHARRRASAARPRNFVRADEPARAPARAARTRTTPTRSASTTRGNYSTRARPGRSCRCSCAATRSSRAVMDRPSAVAAHRRRTPRTSLNRNTLVGAVPVGQRRQDRPHVDRRLRASSGSASRDGVAVIVSVVLGDAERGRAQRRHARAAALGLQRYHRATPVAQGRGRSPAPSCAHRDERAAARGGAHRRAHVVRRGERLPVRVRRRARRARGPAAARGTRVGDDRGHAGAGDVVDRVPLVTRHGDRASALRVQRGERPRWAARSWSCSCARSHVAVAC